MPLLEQGMYLTDLRMGCKWTFRKAAYWVRQRNRVRLSTN